MRNSAACLSVLSGLSLGVGVEGVCVVAAAGAWVCLMGQGSQHMSVQQTRLHSVNVIVNYTTPCQDSAAVVLQSLEAVLQQLHFAPTLVPRWLSVAVSGCDSYI